MSRAAQTVNRECGTEGAIDVGSGELLGRLFEFANFEFTIACELVRLAIFSDT